MALFPHFPYLLFMLILFSNFILSALSVILKQSPLIQSKLVLLYSGSTQITQSFTTTFPHTFTTPFIANPKIAIGNAGYGSLDQLYNQLWSINYALYSNYTGMNVLVRLETNTRMNVLYTSYFAVDGTFQSGVFQIYSSQFTSTQLINTRSGSNNRTDSIVVPITTSTNIDQQSIINCVTNTLHMHNNLDFGFQIECIILFQFNNTANAMALRGIKYVIKSYGQNNLAKIGFYSVIVNVNIISSVNYYQSFLGSVDITSSTTSLSFSALTVVSSSIGNPQSININEVYNASIYMAFSSWGANSGIGANFNWALIVDNSNNRYIRLNNSHRIGIITMNYLVFGIVDCQFWSVINQTCVANCSFGQTIGSSNGICYPCLNTCKSCTNSKNNCTSCISNYYLANQSCILCNNSTHMPQCGYFPNNTNNTNNTNQTIPITPEPVPPAEIQKKTVDEPPYWVAIFTLVPLVIASGYCYYRQKKLKKVMMTSQAPSFRQYPSIQF